MWPHTAMRHGRAAELRGWGTSGSVEFEVRVSIDMGGRGGHTGAVIVAGDTAVGELCWVRVEQAVSPIFRVVDMRALLVSR